VDTYLIKQTHVDFANLFANSSPRLRSAAQANFDGWIATQAKDTSNGTKLKDLLDGISSQLSSTHEHRYIDDLINSYRSLQKTSTEKLSHPFRFVPLLKAHLNEAQQHVSTVFEEIGRYLFKGQHQAVGKARLLPRLSQLSILSHLASDKIANVPLEWKKCFVDYGLAITTVQRAERLLAAAGSRSDLLAELQNPGYQDWDPMEHPEWLLLEIENNILIRKDQAQISREMMLPTSGKNSVMQL